MQMNLNQKCASGASAVGAIDSRARLLEIVNRADNLAIDVSNAVLSADIARRHADDSRLFKDDGKGDNIYFPPHERRILNFIMSDVVDRLSKLDEMADELSNTLSDFHGLMREANASASAASESNPALRGMSLAANIDRFRFYCERFASTEYRTVEETKAGCVATWRPWFDVLLAWDTPAESMDEAIAALRLAREELQEDPESPLAKPMVNAALSYFETVGGAA
ncbi:hypothetical protein G6L97_00705 [Agrobacterium tumefaciens]|uniref:hypothetical protein n=1 Tax=Agrobacterium tumefaciens TaxID=358 RepID=UPI0015727911|nr:hypothetical protein [Agrobacterium tumefaciens]NSZ82926.1 hypothetical protein [Agrobacterium tumefaciens]WCA69159.1 hypothetical protein G6L97_00705 [Agrobacterium tumefaciens]